MAREHTPTPWAQYDSTTYKTLKAVDYERARACVNAFHSPDSRHIPTEQIQEGLVWRMHDALERTTARLMALELVHTDRGKAADYAMIAETKTAAATAYALLDSLKVQEGDG